MTSYSFNKKQAKEREFQLNDFIEWFRNNYEECDEQWDSIKKRMGGVRRREIVNKYKLVDPKFSSHQYSYALLHKLCLPEIAESSYCSMLFYKLKEKA